MSENFMAPIPGQSLTDEPKNYAWERPPEITDHNDAVKYHIERIQDEDVIDNVFFALEYGVPVKTLSEAMMTGAVGAGMHSIDISLIIEPVVREYIMRLANQAGVEYKEDFKPDEPDPMERAALLVRKAIKATPEDERDAGTDFLEEAATAMESEAADDTEEMPDEAMPEEGMTEEPMMQEEKPQGLMARV